MLVVKTADPDWQLIHAAADKLAPKLRTAFREAFDTLAALLPLNDLTDLLEAEAFNELSALIADLRLPDMAPLVNLLASAQVTTATAIGIRFDVPSPAIYTLNNPDILRWTTRRVSDLIVGVTQETKNAVTSIVRQGFIDGIPVRVQARQIRRVVGLTNRDAGAVQRFLTGQLEAGIKQARAETMAQRMTDRLKLRRADVIARTESIRASNQGQLQAWRDLMDAGGLDPTVTRRVWVATIDDRTCFPAGTRISTPDGDRPIEALEPGDIVDTPQGPMPIAATVGTWCKDEWVAIVDSTGQLTISTADHEWWSDGWVEAQTLKIGDCLQSVENKPIYIVGVAKFSLGDADNMPAVCTQLGIPRSVLDRIMPVVAIDLKDDTVTNHEIECSCPILMFLDEPDALPLQGFSDCSFDACLTAETSVAPRRTETSMSSSGRLDPELVTTIATIDKDGRSAAYLRAMPDVTFRRPERCAARPAIPIQGVSMSACQRTYTVSDIHRLRNGECLVAYRADLLNQHIRFVGEVTLSATEPPVSQIVSFARTESNTAMFTGEAVGIDPGCEMVTNRRAEMALAAGTNLSDIFDAAIVADIAEAFTAFYTSHINGGHPVYDITVQGPACFYANGVLVHNCGICAALDGQTVGFLEPFRSTEQYVDFTDLGTGFVAESTKPLPEPIVEQTPPAHPLCLPGDALISTAGRVTGATKRIFDGDMVTVRIGNGNSFRATPNHPILTDSGWVACGDLVPGCNVVSGGNVDRRPSVNVDDSYMPSTIEEVANTFLHTVSVSAGPVPVTAKDFHGDGEGSDVAIVGTDLLLRDDRYTHVTEPTSHGPFVDSGMCGSVRLDSGRNFHAVLNRLDAAAGSVMGGGDLVGTLCRVHARPLQRFSFGLATDSNGTFGESESDSAAGNAETVRESVLRLTGKISTDKVVAVDRDPFHGYVYNLETTTGYYQTNGVVVHNCRCSTALVFDE